MIGGFKITRDQAIIAHKHSQGSTTCIHFLFSYHYSPANLITQVKSSRVIKWFQTVREIDSNKVIISLNSAGYIKTKGIIRVHVT
jgi:hypothetical protein